MIYKIEKLNENFELEKVYKTDFKTLKSAMQYLYDKGYKGNFQIVKSAEKCIFDVYEVVIGFNEIRAISQCNGRIYKY